MDVLSITILGRLSNWKIQGTFFFSQYSLCSFIVDQKLSIILEIQLIRVRGLYLEQGLHIIYRT